MGSTPEEKGNTGDKQDTGDEEFKDTGDMENTAGRHVRHRIRGIQLASTEMFLGINDLATTFKNL